MLTFEQKDKKKEKMKVIIFPTLSNLSNEWIWGNISPHTYLFLNPGTLLMVLCGVRDLPFYPQSKFFQKKDKIVSSEHILLALFSSKRTTNYSIGINYMRIRRFKCLASLIDRKNVLQVLDFFLCSFSYFPRRVHEVHILPLREIFQ